MKFDQATKDRIAKSLNDKGALQPCSRCGHRNFSLLDGFINLPLTQEVSGNMFIGGPQVPCAVTACNNCGNLNYHALGALGMLGEQRK